jgi:hypothetical protein
MKVKCINDIACPYLTVGKEYIVLSENNDFYNIINDNDNYYGYYKNRFVKLEEQKMKAKCISNGYCSFLTLGKEYYILSEDNYFYDIYNDNNSLGSYDKERFVKLEEKRQPKFNEGDTITYNNQYGKIDDVKFYDGNFIYRIGIRNNWFGEDYLTSFVTKVNLENNKEKELKILQNYLISELNKVSDQLERIQSNKR